MKIFLATVGIKILWEALKKHEQKVLKKRKRTMRIALLRIERDTKKDCPYLTGNLKGSYNNDIIVDGSKMIGINGTIVEYAPYAEDHKPHLRPAYEKNLEQNTKDFKDILAKTSF